MKINMRQRIRVLRIVVPAVLVIVFGQGVFFLPEIQISQAGPVLEFDFSEDKESVSKPVLQEKPPRSTILSSSPSSGDIWKEPVTGMEFVWVPGGCYMMGSPLTGKTVQTDPEEHPLWYKALAAVSSLLPYGCVSGPIGARSQMTQPYYVIHGYDEDETPVHEVCLNGFWMGRYEVTQGQWQKIMGNNPSDFTFGDDFPVESVSWEDAQQFISQLSQKSGHRFALPTEVQWEYAARSGGRQEIYAGGNDVNQVAWYSGNSSGKTHQVGIKDPNGLGIYDMTGNVWEWCEDVYDKDAYSKHDLNNPVITSGSNVRVRRGGCWNDSPRFVRAAKRYWHTMGYRSSRLGLRVSLTPDSDRSIPTIPKPGLKAELTPPAARPVPAKPSNKTCGAYTTSGVWKTFDCYNLAAIGKTTNDDPFAPSWRLIGGYWQWGRKGPSSRQWYNTNTRHFAHGPTGPGSGDANSGEISGWDSTFPPSGAWSDSRKTANDPCPSGYRVPTKKQWEGVVKNNTQRIVGSWSDSATNYSSARFFGDNLMLPAGGGRYDDSGALIGCGSTGNYWSSSQSASHSAWSLFFGSGSVSMYNGAGRYGFSVRCAAE